MRNGPGNFTVDDEALQLTERHPERGFIGGDPRRQPRRPIPAEPAPFFRWHGSSPKHIDKLQAFIASGAPLEIEIGSGDGRFIVDRAAHHPERNLLAFEVRYHFARRAFLRVAKSGLDNIWISDDDARYTLPKLIAPGSVSVWHILMPDPWWKRRHQRKRLFTPSFVVMLADLTSPGGILRVETDVAGYARFIADLLAAEPRFGEHDPSIGQFFTADRPSKRQAYCREHNLPIYSIYVQHR